MSKVILLFDKNSSIKDEVINQVQHSAIENGVLLTKHFNGEERKRKLPPETVKVKVITEKTLFRNEELLEQFKNKKEITEAEMIESVEEVPLKKTAAKKSTAKSKKALVSDETEGN